MTQLDITFRPKPKTAPPRLAASHFARQFLRHPQTQLLLLFTAISGAAALLTFGFTPAMALAGLAAFVAALAAEYVVHRFVLHGIKWWRLSWAAAAWSRLHHRHHMYPTETSLLFPPVVLALVAVSLLSLSIGWLVAGPAGAGAALPVGFLYLAFYNYMHAGAHLVADAGTSFGRAVRHRHMLHHLHNEKVNFGITSPLFDWLLFTSATNAETLPRSATARNLGYDARQIARYPALAAIEARPMLGPQ